MSDELEYGAVRIHYVENCARCGMRHDNAVAGQLSQPFSPPEANGAAWTHWFSCPTNGQPVFVTVIHR